MVSPSKEGNPNAMVEQLPSIPPSSLKKIAKSASFASVEMTPITESLKDGIRGIETARKEDHYWL